MVTVTRSRDAQEDSALNDADTAELRKLCDAVALSDDALALFAIAPESALSHPVARAFETYLADELEEPFTFTPFYYGDNSLFNFLAQRDGKLAQENESEAQPATQREVIFAFGLEKLSEARKKQELGQLNLAREKLFERNIILVFWLNHESALDEFRHRAPDFWDWRSQVAIFSTRHQWLHPYLDWLVAEHAHLKISGVM